jgi:alkylhydroperoxidase family enzyme
MPFISLVEKPHGLLGRMAFRWGRRKFGRDVQPLQAAAHHKGLMLASGAVETIAERGWKALDPQLRWLAIQRVSSSIGCSWCVDYGFYLGHQEQVDPVKVLDVTTWRDSSAYDETERLVLEYAEAASATPAVVDAQVVQKLTDRLGEKAMVELAAWVALEHFRSRFNAGLGLRSQGFSDSCELPGATSVSLKVAN